ncbi:unnamed protein product [Vitrella brassicaformis CCMP3155]|uniref:C3H1-type domain-containing protein n=1 Tax=Vitrella brassicaformis (strain CCMP3155) TaxID=1169540 RepID=A0A0G4FFZ5_VITBC|nr:unnamed protein product [Vitrella brassicaformis CCMP3155]|eukprot:CEM12111.1 unnamed protein product [Vitrella brassicaformis CCMP3155]
MNDTTTMTNHHALPSRLSARCWKTKFCKFFMEGRCTRENCTYAHSAEEMRSIPDLRKTKLCGQWLKGRCNDPSCKFAHGQRELNPLCGLDEDGNGVGGGNGGGGSGHGYGGSNLHVARIGNTGHPHHGHGHGGHHGQPHHHRPSHHPHHPMPIEAATQEADQSTAHNRTKDNSANIGHDGSSPRVLRPHHSSQHHQPHHARRYTPKRNMPTVLSVRDSSPPSRSTTTTPSLPHHLPPPPPPPLPADPLHALLGVAPHSNTHSNTQIPHQTSNDDLGHCTTDSCGAGSVDSTDVPTEPLGAGSVYHERSGSSDTVSFRYSSEESPTQSGGSDSESEMDPSTRIRNHLINHEQQGQGAPPPAPIPSHPHAFAAGGPCFESVVSLTTGNGVPLPVAMGGGTGGPAGSSDSNGGHAPLHRGHSHDGSYGMHHSHAHHRPVGASDDIGVGVGVGVGHPSHPDFSSVMMMGGDVSGMCGGGVDYPYMDQAAVHGMGGMPPFMAQLSPSGSCGTPSHHTTSASDVLATWAATISAEDLIKACPDHYDD